MENKNLDLEDFLNEELLGIKPKKEEKKKNKKLEWKETDTKEIFEQEEEEKKKKNDDEYDDDENTRTGSSEDDDPKTGEDEEDNSSPKISPDKVKHKTQGKKVMEVTLELSGQDYGTAEIGDEEYAAITGLSPLLNFFNVDPKKLEDPATATESLTLTVKETISQTGNTVTLTMRSNENDDTTSINVLVNELGQPQDNMQQAVTYFNNVYQTNILNVINKEVRG